MPLITVTQTCITTFEVPEGFSIEELRYHAMDPILSSNIEGEVQGVHRRALEEAYNGKSVEVYGDGVKLEIYEGPMRRE